MSLFKEMKSRQVQKKANDFIQSLGNKSDKDIEQIYLNTKEFENNEIVLSYLFFHHPSLIRILPLEFQKSRLNSNLSMFRYGSVEARKSLVSDWLKNNKFFMNSNVLDLDNEEYISYLKLYFSQPEDVAKLYMEDLKEVITVLSNSDLKATEDLLNKIKDKLTDRQWEFVIVVNPMFIKYASQNIQNKYAEDERFNMYISGSARDNYIKRQIDKIKEDFSLINTMGIDVQMEYIKEYPFMINYLSNEVLIEILKYDIKLIKYVNLSNLKNDQEVIYGILEGIEHKSINDIVDIFLNIGLVNAKGKLFRFDPNSNNMTYQYTKRLIKIIQGLSIEQIMLLINIDVNYVLPYIVPVYNNDTDIEIKENIIIDCDSRCLNLFKAYYGIEKYNRFYKVINKMYSELLENINRYDYSVDYESLFDFFKVLFNKKIMEKNNPEKITLYIGMCLLHKGEKGRPHEASLKLLTDLLTVVYSKEITISTNIYDIGSLEIYDDRLSFINKELLEDYSKYNFVNMSSLLFIVKSDKNREIFKRYYDIYKEIYGENKESLYKAVENYHYYKEIMIDIENKDLSQKETNNLIDLLSTSGNYMNITKMNELSVYDVSLLKKLINELSGVKESDVYKNILCNYLFNKGYDKNGISGWLEVSTIKEICDVFESDTLSSFTKDGKKIFTSEEVNLFNMIKMMFSVSDADMCFQYIDNLINNGVTRNIISVIDFFNKLKKYKCDIINEEIVTLEDIEMLYEEDKSVVKKEISDGVEIYTIINQDFKVFCSYTNNGINYAIMNISDLEKNAYGYNKIIDNGVIRFTTYEDNTLIKYNKDRIEGNGLNPEFIIVIGEVTDDLKRIAKKNNYKIIYIRS